MYIYKQILLYLENQFSNLKHNAIMNPSSSLPFVIVDHNKIKFFFLRPSLKFVDLKFKMKNT